MENDKQGRYNQIKQELEVLRIDFQAARLEIERLRTLDNVLGRLERWAHEFGSALCPNAK